MKGSFTVPASALASAVKYTARWVDAKPTVPVYGGLLFEALPMGGLVIASTSENATATAFIADTQDGAGSAEGAFVVAGRLLDQLVSTFPDRPVTFEQDGPIVVVTSGSGRWTLPAMSENDYPTLPQQARPAGVVDDVLFADAVHRVAIAAGRDLETLPALAGLHIHFADTGEERYPLLTLSATDKYRAARKTIPWAPEMQGAPIGESVLPFAHILLDAVDAFTDDITIGYEQRGLGAQVLSLATATRSLVLRTLRASDHPALDMGPMYEYRGPETATLRPADLLLPMRRAALLGDPKADLVQLTFEDGMVAVHAGAEGRGDGDEEVAVEYGGPPCQVALKASMLQAGLASAPGDSVSLSLTPGGYKPVVFTSPDDPSWRYLMMPLRNLGGSK